MLSGKVRPIAKKSAPKTAPRIFYETQSDFTPKQETVEVPLAELHAAAAATAAYGNSQHAAAYSGYNGAEHSSLDLTLKQAEPRSNHGDQTHHLQEKPAHTHPHTNHHYQQFKVEVKKGVT